MNRERAVRALGAWFDGGVQPEPLGAGHINDTWLVRHGGRGYVLQRISDAVFPDPAGVAARVAEVVADGRKQWQHRSGQGKARRDEKSHNGRGANACQIRLQRKHDLAHPDEGRTPHEGDQQQHPRRPAAHG